LLRWKDGDLEARDQLIPLVYDELHGLARQYMAGERADHTLQPTALVNEAYLRLIQVRRVSWADRRHFFAMSARIMRRVLVDFARARRSHKRGAGEVTVSFDEDFPIVHESAAAIIAVDDALATLAQLDQRKCHVIELRFFAGLTIEETAEVLKVSTDTVLRDWRMAKAWLSRELSESRDVT
jgi:RNA polymerase sigma factor (TIGR02999 family)